MFQSIVNKSSRSDMYEKYTLLTSNGENNIPVFTFKNMDLNENAGIYPFILKMNPWDDDTEYWKILWNDSWSKTSI